MRIRVTFTKETTVDEIPKTCMECPFSETCDNFLPGLSIRGGMLWSKAAMTRRHKRCPLEVVE